MRKRAIFAIAVLLTIPVGGCIGTFLGLVSTTFIPTCCDEYGCHNCLEIHGRYGYEVTAVVGFCIGTMLFPLLSILLLYILDKRKKNNSKQLPN